jgi:TRAP-type uncharacterized transport system fused permease subunit
MNTLGHKQKEISLQRYRTLTGLLRWIFVIFSALGILIAIYQLFHFEFLGVMTGDAYYYLLIALFLPLFFLIAPRRKKLTKERVPWYDLMFAGLTFIAPIHFFLNAYKIIEGGWEIIPPITYPIDPGT